MSYVVYAGNTTSYVGFTMPSDNYVAAQFDYKALPTDNRGMMFDNATGRADVWRGAAQDGSGVSARASRIYIDGVQFVGGTRDALHTALHDGVFHTVRIELYGMSSSEAATTSHPSGSIVRFGAYNTSDVFCPPCEARNFKIKLGAQSSPTDWDFESELGDTNGFSQNNVTVVTETGSALANMIQQHAAMGYV